MKRSMIVLTLILCVSLVYAAIPDSINIHGKLLNNGGSPLEGTFDITFRFYDDPSAGSVLYSDLQTITTDSGGIFTTLLPDVDVVDWDQDTWMELAIEGEVLSPRINTTSVPSAFAGTGSSLWSETGSDIYYDSGNVGIGQSSPTSTLELQSTGGLTELRLDSGPGVLDGAITFFNQGTKEFDICFDDSSSDELKFIRGANTACAGKDTFTITQSALEMGTAIFMYDAPTRWYRAPCCSAAGNNFFEIDDTLGSLPDITSVSAGQQGMVAYVICSDTTSIMKDEALGGNLQLNGDFDCSVVGVGSTLTMVYFDNAQHSWDWHEIGRSLNN